MAETARRWHGLDPDLASAVQPHGGRRGGEHLPLCPLDVDLGELQGSDVVGRQEVLGSGRGGSRDLGNLGGFGQDSPRGDDPGSKILPPPPLECEQQKKTIHSTGQTLFDIATRPAPDAHDTSKGRICLVFQIRGPIYKGRAEHAGRSISNRTLAEVETCVGIGTVRDNYKLIRMFYVRP